MHNIQIINKEMKIKIFLMVFLICLSPYIVFADWQEILEQHFDQAITFDNLQNWTGTSAGGNTTTIQAYPDDLPKKPDGTHTSIQFYSYWNHDETPAKGDWIGDHGPAYNWLSNKSLCIDSGELYCEDEDDGSNDNDFDDTLIDGYGPSAIHGYFGNWTEDNNFTGDATSGYHVLHFFYMLKWHKGYFVYIDPTDIEQGFRAQPVVKMNRQMTGFTQVYQYGYNACENYLRPRFTSVYGTNQFTQSLVGGFNGSERDVFFNDSTCVTSWRDQDSCYVYDCTRDEIHMGSGYSFGDVIRDGEWVALEFIYDLGTLGESDGRQEVKAYTQYGKLLWHWDTGPINMQKVYPGNFNKYMIGGNYQCQNWSGVTGNTRFFIDDLIIDDAEIAPIYFSVLYGNGTRINLVSPKEELQYGTTSVDVTINTYNSSFALENATCKYSLEAGTPFSSMTQSFLEISTGVHTATITGLTNGSDYNLYVKCDNGTVINSKDYPIRLVVDNQPKTCADYNVNARGCAEMPGCEYQYPFCVEKNDNQNIRADVDNNSTINSTDAMLTLRNSLGLDMSGTSWQTSTTTGDVNCDENSNSTDAMLILRYSLGLDMSGTGWCL